ncbi:MAG: CarD family transcriptional regulator [Agathobaculum sp.]|jgi:CarD family transcriptional regulator|uniref:CarD family transcriptional regulator n=1 Tax=Agathobaculum sp. TaxID=2048138 RepID=UPI003D902B00
MFQIGDKIVHPLHGAGIIVDIVTRAIDGVPAPYYALKLALDDTELFLPVESCEKLGVRQVCSREQAEALLQRFGDISRTEEKGWNQRYRENMLHLRSGDLLEVAQVIKNLSERDRERGLSAGEKKMLVSARQIIDSELAFALDISPQQAAELVNAQLCIE